MEEELKQKEEENGKLQDEIDEKENEIEVCIMTFVSCGA